ncbi:hypothetical protein PR001_g19345 [Phytophthora rubi]|uniref:Uncharacterized protein n=1 Tax=Phytophthora rubi TaxID=129364 RepID=A0A6A3JSQ2_9STRA|nr:hypothetical protein PR001_g19345 [Phytophthora rubi]
MPVPLAVLTPASGHFPVQACASPVFAGGLCGWRPQHPLELCLPSGQSMEPCPSPNT